MSAVRSILKRRRDRREDARRSVEARTRRFSLGCGFTLSLLLATLILGATLFYADLTRSLPSVEILPGLLNPPDGLLLEPTRIYDRTGQHILKTFAPSESPRRYIPLDPGNPQHLPDSLVQATIALADPTFWEHSGFAWTGLDNPRLHPTLTQQMVSDLLLWDEPSSFKRAVRERLLAAQITYEYRRSQVIEWYLNSANYGNFAYGADAAAQLYFGKSAAELTPAEAAILAGVSQAPSLNPLDAPQAALQRGRETVHIMQALGFLSEEEAGRALAESPAFSPSPTGGRGDRGEGGISPAFLNLVLQQLDTQFDRARIERGGLTITTTLDFELQYQASCAMQVYMARLQGSSNIQTDCEAARLLPSLPSGLLAPEPVASAVITDPRSGQVLAVVGESYRGQETALLSEHDSGSLLTPFVYLTGFTRGLSPASLVWDVPGLATIRNTNDEYHGPVRLRLALANDYLGPAAQVLDQMGLENVARTTNSFGLDVGPDSVPLRDSIPLGLLDVSGAYGVLAAGGVKYGNASDEGLAPVIVLRVETADHAVWLDANNPAAQSVVTPQLAYLLNHILSDEPARWPSLGHPNSFEIGRPVGAKTGVTLDGLDAWAVGYTPHRVVTVWTGTRATVRAASTPVRDGRAGSPISPRLPAGLWHALMQIASRELPPDGWSAPAGITQIEVCDPSGLLPTEDCPTVVREIFANGSEPTQPDNLYRIYEINRETGFLATVFTPPHLVEQQVYMAFPLEARDWAESNGFSPPPDSYDAIQTVTSNPNVYISAPAMFADVRGEVEIMGTASGENLDYFRVLVGQGLNPRSWVQVGEDSSSPVLNDTLATWDTSELNGLYALQLQAVHTDQRVDTAVVQVTVDNTPPELSVTFPQEGDELDYSANRQITFQAQAVDNLSLAVVEFYIGSARIGTFDQGPFGLSWNATRGEHVLRVIARDRAGNESDEEIRFVVE
jgi:membrane peptidoglycan carboxypeptidase